MCTPEDLEYRTEVKKLIEEIKNGLEEYLRSQIHQEMAKVVLSKFFSVTCDCLSDEDYEAMIQQVCNEVEDELL